MSYHLQLQVCKNADTGFYKSDTEFALMRALVSFADNDGGSCFPSFPKLLERVRCKRTTLYKVLKEFAKRGWITIEHTRSSNVYQILPHGCVRPSSSKSEHLDVPGGSKSEHQGSKIQTPGIQRLNAGGPTVEHNSCHRLSSNTASQIDYLSNSADALMDIKKLNFHQGAGRKQEGNQETASTVAKLKETAGVRTPLDSEGDCEGYPFAARTGPGGDSITMISAEGDAEQEEESAECDAKHMLVAAFIEAYKDAEKNRPLGMPCLEEFFVEAKKIQLSGKEAMTLYDVWLANGFRTKSGPIKDWRAAMRNWKRWVANGGNSVFS